MPPARDEHLAIPALETWLWDAACAIRGATDAPRFKDFISPSQFVTVADRAQHRPLDAILADIALARDEREHADAALAEVLGRLGLG